MKNIFFVSIVLLYYSCDHSTSNDESTGAFTIYLLQDSTIATWNALSQPIERLILERSAFLSVNDFKSYVWTTHTFTLTTEMQTRYDQFMSSHITGTGIPFVVIVGNERIYFGTFWSSYSSIVLPQCAFIDVSFNTCRIQLAKGAIDKRSDTRIYKSLKQSGVLIE